ncbi:MAG: hypothetical protein KGR17_09535, partial [Acidobacteria bacterium]|nr:hypothetical protein [Acidobacteriota bacterium]
MVIDPAMSVATEACCASTQPNGPVAVILSAMTRWKLPVPAVSELVATAENEAMPPESELAATAPKVAGPLNVEPEGPTDHALVVIDPAMSVAIEACCASTQPNGPVAVILS